MSSLKLFASEGAVSWLLANAILRSSIVVSSAIAWRPKMQHLTIQAMMTMHYIPQLDRKLIRYGVSWIVAIATSMIGVVAYA